MGSRIYRRWTPEAIDQLKELYKTGLTYQEIGDRLGRDKDSIKSKVHGLGLNKDHTLNYWTPDEIERLRELVSQRLSVAEIADRLDRSACSVQSQKRYLSLTKKRQNIRHNVEEAARVIALYESGYTLAEIAARYNLCISTVSFVLKKYDCETKYTRVKAAYPLHAVPWQPFELVQLRRLLRRGASEGELYRSFPQRHPRTIRFQSAKIKRSWSVKDPIELWKQAVDWRREQYRLKAEAYKESLKSKQRLSEAYRRWREQNGLSVSPTFFFS